MNFSIFLIPVFLFTLASCTKKLKYTKEDLYAKAKAADPTAKFILPRNMNEGIFCTDYTEGCVAAHTVKIKGLDLIAVEFNEEEEAKRAAIKYKGYYIRNWLLDDVTGEPELEKFVVEELEAKKP